WISKSEGISIKFHPWVNTTTIQYLKRYLEASSDKGTSLVEIFEDGKSQYTKMIFQEKQRPQFINDLQNLPILYNQKIIPLKAIANVEMVSDNFIPIFFDQETRLQSITVNLKDQKEKKSSQVIDKLKQEILNMERPIGVNIDFPDNNKEINKSFDSFKNSLIVSILLVFLIIAVFFNSLKYPLIIIVTVPLAITGILVGLYITNSTVSLNSMLGTILLSGLVVNNAILLIDFYIKAKTTMSPMDAILESTSLRFRPIIMTTLTTLLGVIPIALAFGESGEILQPLGISVFFGLLISTLLTLFVIPCFLSILEN
ncbi:efflux RND transporter permease subunit, partial [bacterium]|nr:efflux RND transporter permease subunit [bacterium]